MSNQIFDFPPDDLPSKEKTKKEPPAKKPSPPRGKSILGKLLFFILIVALILAGFGFIQKTLIDLEAQAQIYAVQTASAISSPAQNNTTPLPPTLQSFPPTEVSALINFTATTQPPSKTATLDPDFMHTATIAAQLTLAAK